MEYIDCEVWVQCRIWYCVEKGLIINYARTFSWILGSLRLPHSSSEQAGPTLQLHHPQSDFGLLGSAVFWRFRWRTASVLPPGSLRSADWRPSSQHQLKVCHLQCERLGFRPNTADDGLRRQFQRTKRGCPSGRIHTKSGWKTDRYACCDQRDVILCMLALLYSVLRIDDYKHGFFIVAGIWIWVIHRASSNFGCQRRRSSLMLSKISAYYFNTPKHVPCAWVIFKVFLFNITKLPATILQQNRF